MSPSKTADSPSQVNLNSHCSSMGNPNAYDYIVRYNTVYGTRRRLVDHQNIQVTALTFGPSP